MNGRILTTTEQIIAIVSSDGSGALDRLQTWSTKQEIPLETVEVGENIGDIYDPEGQTIGVTLGGDGTYLEGVRVFGPKNIPFLGVNTGTLAFLATVSPSDLEAALTEVLDGRAEIDTRQQLSVQTAGAEFEHTGINDVMVEHIPPENPFDRKITDLDVFIDGEYVGEYQGSGLAVATPTGSTGVSLSAGGPVHYPKDNDSLQVIPLQTHSIGVRPLITDATKSVTIVPRSPASLLVDGGRAHTELYANEAVQVSGSETEALVVNTSYDDYVGAVITIHLASGEPNFDGVGEVYRDAMAAYPEKLVFSYIMSAEARGEWIESLEGTGVPVYDFAYAAVGTLETMYWWRQYADGDEKYDPGVADASKSI